jgi:hypothetical protein
MQADGFIDLFMQFAPSLHVMRGEPAADAFGLEVGMQAFGKVLVLGGVTDEAGIELNRVHCTDQRFQVGNEWFGDASTTQENLGDRAFRENERVNINNRSARVSNGFQVFYLAQVHQSQSR